MRHTIYLSPKQIRALGVLSREWAIDRTRPSDLVIAQDIDGRNTVTVSSAGRAAVTLDPNGKAV
jgi:hypothetical protein